MASPARIFAIYQRLYADAAEVKDFQVAQGEKVSGTVNLLLSGDRAKVLSRWGDEMHEICGVLAGTHDDPYVLEATQTWYWASLFAVMGGVDWASLDFTQLKGDAARSGLGSVDLLLPQVDRLVAMGEDAPANKCFLLWCVADVIYRSTTPPEQQRSIEEIMECDLHDMKKRPYLQPILNAVPEAV